jgi:serine/threonine protein kinase
MTPPKRPKNDVNEELTKKDYRERKQIRPEEDLASRFDSDYEVLGTLGTGYFGMVKKCRNKIDGAVYAIKIMGCNDRKNLNEVKAMAILSNKECSNIVRYHHSWIENRKLYMVM